MSSLKADFDELRERIRHGRKLGHASFEPIYYLVFPPEQILEVKRQTPAWVAKLHQEAGTFTPSPSPSTSGHCSSKPVGELKKPTQAEVVVTQGDVRVLRRKSWRRFPETRGQKRVEPATTGTVSHHPLAHAECA